MDYILKFTPFFNTVKNPHANTVYGSY
jgi:hypothetical protein